MCPSGDSNEKTMPWPESLFQPLFQKIFFIISLCFETCTLPINYIQFWFCTGFKIIALANKNFYTQYAYCINNCIT